MCTLVYILFDPGSEEILVSRSFRTNQANEVVEVFGINDQETDVSVE